MTGPHAPSPSASQAARKAKRLSVTIASRIRHKGMQSAEVTIRDLAFTGFRADCALELAKGERISIDLPPFGLVPAKIAWCREGMVGGLFDSVVDIRHCVLKPDELSYFASQRRRPGLAATGR